MPTDEWDAHGGWDDVSDDDDAPYGDFGDDDPDGYEECDGDQE